MRILIIYVVNLILLGKEKVVREHLKILVWCWSRKKSHLSRTSQCESTKFFIRTAVYCSDWALKNHQP